MVSRQVIRADARAAAKAAKPTAVVPRSTPALTPRSKYQSHIGAKERGRYARTDRIGFDGWNYGPISGEMFDLFEASKRRVAAMTPAEREAMYAKQREGYARAEASWPKPKFEMLNGIKIYTSYEDYCND